MLLLKLEFNKKRRPVQQALPRATQARLGSLLHRLAVLGPEGDALRRAQDRQVGQALHRGGRRRDQAAAVCARRRPDRPQSLQDGAAARQLPRDWTERRPRVHGV